MPVCIAPKAVMAADGKEASSRGAAGGTRGAGREHAVSFEEKNSNTKVAKMLRQGGNNKKKSCSLM